MNQSILHMGTRTLEGPHLARCVTQATTLLAEQPYFRSRMRQIRVELSNEGLVLLGTLSSFYLKQMAQETLRPLGLPISNQIRVS